MTPLVHYDTNSVDLLAGCGQHHSTLPSDEDVSTNPAKVTCPECRDRLVAAWIEQYQHRIRVWTTLTGELGVCTSLPDDALDKAIAERPDGSWVRAEAFADGHPNPRPCDVAPKWRRHVLYEART